MSPDFGSLAVGVVVGVLAAALCIVAFVPAYGRRMRAEAVRQSRAVTRGQIYEQLVPYLPGFGFNPKDAQFLGRPVDLVVFDGLDEGDLRRIVFIEVKTGDAKLSTRERLVRDAILDGRVEWSVIRADRRD